MPGYLTEEWIDAGADRILRRRVVEADRHAGSRMFVARGDAARRRARDVIVTGAALDEAAAAACEEVIM